MIGIALLGAGRMARVHAKTIGAAGGRLVTVYDIVEQAAKSLAADTGASAARSVEEALHHPEADAVLVVTSSDTHVDCILQGIQAGKPVMCEKPLAPTLSDGSGTSTPWVPKQARSFLRLTGVSIRGMQRSRARSRRGKSEPRATDHHQPRPCSTTA